MKYSLSLGILYPNIWTLFCHIYSLHQVSKLHIYQYKWRFGFSRTKYGEISLWYHKWCWTSVRYRLSSLHIFIKCKLFHFLLLFPCSMLCCVMPKKSSDKILPSSEDSLLKYWYCQRISFENAFSNFYDVFFLVLVHEKFQ